MAGSTSMYELLWTAGPEPTLAAPPLSAAAARREHRTVPTSSDRGTTRAAAVRVEIPCEVIRAFLKSEPATASALLVSRSGAKRRQPTTSPPPVAPVPSVRLRLEGAYPRPWARARARVAAIAARASERLLGPRFGVPSDAMDPEKCVQVDSAVGQLVRVVDAQKDRRPPPESMR